MHRRLLVAAALLAAAVPAMAQTREGLRSQGEEASRAELDRLFEALRTAPDEASAALVEARIRALWAETASPAVVLLLRRGMRNMQAQAPDEALEDFDASLILQPDLAEAWHLRAQAYAALGDGRAAARDLQQALRLEPRHFGALLTLSRLQEDRGEFEDALRSFEAVLKIHPKLPGAEQRLRELQRKAFGDTA